MMWVDEFVSCATYLKRDGSEPGDHVWRCDTVARNSGFSPRAHRRQLTVLCNLYHSNALVPTGTVHK